MPLELHSVVVENELRIGVGLVSQPERLSYIVFTGGVPHRSRTQFVGGGVGSHDGLVVIEHLVAHVPLGHLALVVRQNVVNVAFHYG